MHTLFTYLHFQVQYVHGVHTYTHFKFNMCMVYILSHISSSICAWCTYFHAWLAATTIEFEPTYRLEPTEKVPIADIKNMMKQEMDELLHGLEYSILEAPNWAKVSFFILHLFYIIYCVIITISILNAYLTSYFEWDAGYLRIHIVVFVLEILKLSASMLGQTTPSYPLVYSNLAVVIHQATSPARFRHVRQCCSLEMLWIHLHGHILLHYLRVKIQATYF